MPPRPTVVRGTDSLLPFRTAAAVVVALAAAWAPASAQDHDHHGDPAAVGDVAFPTGCREDVRPDFETAVAMLHSFWFEQAHEAFGDVARRDPTCAMAEWGVAMTLMGNPFTRVPVSESRLSAARAAVERARRLAAGATPRERAYIDAVAAFYDGYRERGHAASMAAHEAAMDRVRRAFADDPEATIFYARAVIGNAPPDDMTYARQLHAAEILEPLFLDRPRHPGLAHYLIHAYDAPPIAHRGLDAARRYAAIAPDAPHAQHMPSHIFTRLGHWDESIETNRRSADAEPVPAGAVHPLDYMVYAYLQQGRDAEAARVVDGAVRVHDRFYEGVVAYNYVAMQARMHLERSHWDDAARMPLTRGAPPYVLAVAHFTRGLGAARGRPADLDRTRDEIATLAALRDGLAADGDAYWATVVDAQRLAVEAWLAFASGDVETATALAHDAAQLEESVEKHPVTPGPLLPARELQADMLLELGRHTDALAAYRRTLEREPNRARALFGAARAAAHAGDSRAARDYFGRLLALMDRADADRPEPAAARAFIASH